MPNVVNILIREIYYYIHSNGKFSNALQDESLVFNDKFKSELIKNVINYLGREKSDLFMQIERKHGHAKKIAESLIVAIFLLSHRQDYTNAQINCFSNLEPSFIGRVRNFILNLGQKKSKNKALIIRRERIEEMESMVEEKGRYSTESVRISRSRFPLKELDRLADRSRALTNDTLYLFRQYYFFHATKNLEKKNLYRKNIIDKYYKTIKQSEYPNEKKKAALEILKAYFKDGLRALKSTVPTVMKFMESYKDIGYSGLCPAGR